MGVGSERAASGSSASPCTISTSCTPSSTSPLVRSGAGLRFIDSGCGGGTMPSLPASLTLSSSGSTSHESMLCREGRDEVGRHDDATAERAPEMPRNCSARTSLAVVLALFTLTAHDKVAAAVTVVLIGALGFATVPPLQKRVLDQAHGAPTLASAMNIGAFNLGNALASWLGGLAISAGLGWTAPNWVGALLAAAALALARLEGDTAFCAPLLAAFDGFVQQQADFSPRLNPM